MPIPTHSINCYTKAYKTGCPDCKQEVWFFSCSCGSRVYFNELGYPWSIHDCRQRWVREAIELLRTNDRLTDTEIYTRIDIYASNHGYEIPDEFLEILDIELGKRRRPLNIQRVNDLSTYSDISGKVMEINKVVSFRSRLKIDLNNQFQVQLAGDLLKFSFAEIILRTNPDDSNKCLEYCIFVKRDLLKKLPITKGKVILGLINPIKNGIIKTWALTDYIIH